MESAGRWNKGNLVRILWMTSLAVLCAAPAIQADVIVPIDEEWDINYEVLDFLKVYGTANIATGAYAAYGIEAHSGSVVRVRGGNIGPGYTFTVFDNPTAATVTVYGTDFKDDGVPIGYGPWTPGGGSGTLTGSYEDGTSINLLFYSDVSIILASTDSTNLPPVAIAGLEGLIGPGGKIHPIYSIEQSTTSVLGQASDPEGQPIEYRWLEGSTVLLDWTSVVTPSEAYLDLSTIEPFSLGDHTLTLEVRETEGETPLSSSDNMVLRILGSLLIDIKPGSYPNSINLGSNGVVPVAILSTGDFDATLIPADKVFLAGAGVAVRGKGKNTLAHEEDVNGDGLVDLVVKVETENLDPGAFQNGGASLQIRESSDPESPILYEGWDEISIVPQQ